MLIGGSITSGFGNDLAGVIGKTAMSGVQSFANNAATGAINSITYTHGGGFGFDASAYTEGLWGTNAIAGYVGTMAGTFVSEGLNSVILGEEQFKTIDGQQKLVGYRNFEGMGLENIGHIKSLTGLVGNAVNASFEYGLSGQTTLSMLRINNVGLLEMRLGGGRSMFGLGMNGIDLSAGRLVDSFRGIHELNMNARINSAAANDIGGDASVREKAAKMRMLYSFGDDEGQRTLWNVLNGKDRLEIGSMVPENARGKTVLDAAGNRTIYATSSNSDDFNVWLAESVTLEHESYRDGSLNADNDLETQRVVRAHSEMAERMTKQFGFGFVGTDINLARDMINNKIGGEAFAKYVGENYDSSADYWKLTKDGRLVNDNRANLYDENGNLLFNAQRLGVGENDIVGGLKAILAAQGLNQDEVTKAAGETMLGLMKNHGEALAPEALLHYLDAKDQYNVLDARGRLQGLYGSRISYEEFTFRNARDTSLKECNSLLNAIYDRPLTNDADLIGGLTQQFFSMYKANSSQEMLSILRSGLRNNLKSDLTAVPDLMILFTERIFRGAGGDMGLARALEADYGAGKGFDAWKGRTGRDDVTRDQWASGMMIQDVAITFTEDYMHMIYSPLNAEGKEYTGGAYNGNYDGELNYSDRIVTRRFSPIQRNSFEGNPEMDCIGFVNMVYPAAGKLNYGEDIRDRMGSISGKSNLGPIGWDNPKMQLEYGNQRGAYANDLDLDLKKFYDYHAYNIPAGVDDAYYSKYLNHPKDPIPGDLLFMEGHIGIYGEDSSSGRSMMIHSAPAIALGEGTYWGPDPFGRGGTYNSGPRINYFNDLGNIRRTNDPYMNILIGRYSENPDENWGWHLCDNFKKWHGNIYGRWRGVK